MKPYKIAITGRFRTGKDTVAGMIAAELATTNTTIMGFADAVKQELSDMVANYTQPLDMFSRDEAGLVYANRGAYAEHLQKMLKRRDINGTGWQWWGEYRRQMFDEGYWIGNSTFQNRYRSALASGHNVIIADMRHHNEAEWCIEQGFYLIRVEGPCRATEARDPNHPSEVHVPELKVHWTVYNTDTLDVLRNVIHWLMERGIAKFFGR